MTGMNGTIYVEFAGADAPKITVGAGTGAFGVDPWKAAGKDVAWQAEQAEFLKRAAPADREALDQDQ